MSHARQQIREAVVAAVTGLTTTGSNVYESRIFNLDPANTPALNVVTTSEEVDEEMSSRSSSGFLLVRELGVEISAFVMASSDSDDLVDTVCAEVEAAIAGNAALQALVQEITLRSTEIELLAEGERPIAKAAITFEAIYTTLENDAEVIV